MGCNGQPQARPLIPAFCGLPCVLCLVYLNSKFLLLAVFYSMSASYHSGWESPFWLLAVTIRYCVKLVLFFFFSFFSPPHFFLSVELTEIPFRFRPLLWGTESFLDVRFLSCLGKGDMCWVKTILRPDCLYRWESIWAEENFSEWTGKRKITFFFLPFNLMMK